MTGGGTGDPGGGRFDDAQSVRSLSADQLREVVASTWRASGWRVEAADADEDLFVATRGEDGETPRERRLLQVLCGGREPSAPTVRRAVEFMRRHDADGAVVVSTVGFGSGAVAVADAYGVDLVGPAALARAVDTTDEDAARDD
ncbi:restriction endonuclease [Halobaculum marinum]|uniref:Restriction endonuclease n=1 Tax=Halobaculum marinum TaxID=3031996 RepID=A0ABD5X7I0_9EURY|nr:restriction endonuclease [Halobaculum sp. DT55]